MPWHNVTNLRNAHIVVGTCHGMSADATPLTCMALGDMPWHVTTTYCINRVREGEGYKNTNPACLNDRRDANEINVIVTMMINNYFFKCVFVITSIFK